MVPKWLIKATYPIDKTDLDMLRLTHFLALALVVTRYFPRKSEILSSKWLRPMVLCGQHSLPIFCFGVFLSFGAHWILVQHAQGGARALWMQLLVSVGGVLIMIGLAWPLERAISWRQDPTSCATPRDRALGSRATLVEVALGPR
jgi:hypothetical protein